MARGISVAAFVLSFFIPVVGFVLGIVALREERAAGESGTLPIAAIVIGAIYTAVILVFVMIAASSPVDPHRYTFSSTSSCGGDRMTLWCSRVRFVESEGSVLLSVENRMDDEMRVVRIETDGACGVEVLTPPTETAPRRGEFFVHTDTEFTIDPVIGPAERFLLEAHCEHQRVGSTFEDRFTVHYEVGGRSEHQSFNVVARVRG